MTARSALGAATVLIVTSLGQVSIVDAGPSNKPVTIVAFGDSLTAGYRLSKSEAFPAKLEKALREKGYNVKIQNAGVSGDTSSSGFARVRRDVSPAADLVIVQFGANDIFRGVPPSTTEKNLDAIIGRVTQNGSDVILAGMILPKGMGNAFSRSFDAIYERVAARHGATLYPFFLADVAARASLNLNDGIHPNAKGVDRIVEGILPTVAATIDRMS